MATTESRGLPEGWKRHNDYCIRKAGWYIAKCFVDGATLYVLHDEAGTRYGNFESAADAVSYADSLDLGMTA